VTSPTEIPKPNSKNFLNRSYKACRIRGWFEHFSSSVDWPVATEKVEDDIPASAVLKGF